MKEDARKVFLLPRTEKNFSNRLEVITVKEEVTKLLYPDIKKCSSSVGLTEKLQRQATHDMDLTSKGLTSKTAFWFILTCFKKGLKLKSK